MIIVADSGSTKTDWALIDGQKVDFFMSEGINPRQLSKGQIEQILQEQVAVKVKGCVDQVYFFGAGCGSNIGKENLHSALKSVFAIEKCTVDTDLVGAARALYGDKQGVIAILGTGANCGFWNGESISEQPVSLGYLIGDEGSGFYIGKLLIEYFLKKNMPTDISDKLEHWDDGSVANVVSDLYASDKPNRFLAKFSRFASENKSHDFIQALLDENFNLFFRDYISKINGFKQFPIKFVGSVADAFAPQIKNMAWRYGCSVAAVEKTIINRLANYYKEL